MGEKAKKTRVWVLVAVIFVVILVVTAATVTTVLVLQQQTSSDSKCTLPRQYKAGEFCVSCNCSEIRSRNETPCNCLQQCPAGKYKVPTGDCTTCSCSGFGLHVSEWNSTCNPDNGVCRCDPKFNVHGEDCSQCKQGYESSTGAEPDNNGCIEMVVPTIVRPAISLSLAADPVPLISDAKVDPRGGHFSSDIPQLGTLTIDAPNGVLGQDGVSLSVAFYNGSGSFGGLRDNVSSVGILDMTARASDVHSNFELFGQVFEDSLKIVLIPTQDKSRLLLPYFYDEENEALEGTGLSAPAGETGSAKLEFDTKAFGKVALLSVEKSEIETLKAGNIDTGFRPRVHGWISTHDSWPTFSGMALFARWFFLAHSESSLYAQSSNWTNETVDRMLTTLQLRCSEAPRDVRNMTDQETAEILIHSLFVTLTPQLLFLYYYDGWAHRPGHAVLVYGYDNGTFYVYDPEYGPVPKELKYDLLTGKFSQFGDRAYNRFYVYSHKSFQLTHYDMEVVYDFALEQFASDSLSPVIHFDYFPSNISDDSLTIRGKVSVSANGSTPLFLFCFAIKKFSEGLTISQGQASFGNNGEFSKVLIDLEEGEYKIVFLAVGYQPSNITKRSVSGMRSSFYRRAAYNEKVITSRHIEDALRITLEWEDGSSDLDLHVLEPSNGEHVYYSHRDGTFGYLDYDNTNGFGPENYIIKTTDRDSSQAVTGTYQIRIHYYGNGDSRVRPIRWSVLARVGGFDNTKAFSGILSTDNSDDSDNFYNSDNSWSKTFSVDLKTRSLIAIADRSVKNTLGAVYHYSLQFWSGILTLPNESGRRNEAAVDKLRKLNPNAAKKGVELLAISSGSSCSSADGYHTWMLYVTENGRCWRLESVTLSSIVYSESGTKFIPIFLHEDDAVVKKRWQDVERFAQTYAFAEQPGKSINNFPNSIYCIGFDVNNSNTFIQWLTKKAGLPFIKMGGIHPGRESPKPPSQLENYGGAFCGSNNPPSLTGSMYPKCELISLYSFKLFKC